MTSVRILQGDCRDMLPTLPAESVHCCVTSPPYFGLRDYGHDGQIGLEQTPEAFVAELVAVFREVRRVLRDDGTLWLNLGDSYNAYNGNRGVSTGEANGRHHEIMPGLPKGAGLTVASLKQKDLIGIPWRVAFALQADGWYLRQDIIWSKPNPMPESVRDRCTKAHEYLFLLSKSPRYYFDSEAMQEPANYPEGAGNIVAQHIPGEREGENANLCNGLHKCGPRDTRNKRSVWTVAAQPYSEAHFATFPPALIDPCIKAGCPEGGTVLDPFFGAGTTGLVANRLQRNAIGIELNAVYINIAEQRIYGDAPLFAEVDVS